MTSHPILAQRATLNPYLLALRLALNRLRWDLNPEALRSRRRLHASRDRHAGSRAVILCNGPSLLSTDFDRLAASDAFVFGLNKINLLFPRTDLRPGAIVAVNPFVIEQNLDFFRTTGIDLYLDSGSYPLVGRRDNLTYLHSAPAPHFARDCSVSVYQGYTVTFVALQLAFHMGFTDVALVGCDHDFSSKGPANMEVVAAERDADHFDPDYFPQGATWQLPDLAQSEASYALAREAYEAAGRRVLNCTVGGKLEIFARMSLETFLAD
ncbi:6-hydroxymethylpterin diphosphokinase MptE-like protein [Cognatiluteimonas lumbrici]|uniref:6-hydroxymethylpterin diphosphokinase MptE-like protein n=1 Tax=Cognatiluteimonas lumbrici TaxID=2559601 RepID=UPI00112D1EB7|nr:6-hydroxymethylpterin diphosphokinase MptE-like protein [Luteimonas lumbrici]